MTNIMNYSISEVGQGQEGGGGRVAGTEVGHISTANVFARGKGYNMEGKENRTKSVEEDVDLFSTDPINPYRDSLVDPLQPVFTDEFMLSE